MRPGWWARRFIAFIHRYRAWGRGRGSACRFEPSCSTFALEAFRTRVFVVALASTGWRVLRCNPLARGHRADPVRRKRVRIRPNATATVSLILALTGLGLIGLTSIALAQGVTGGCSAMVSGRDPSTMTRSDPLLVREGDVVQVAGTVPASVQAVPQDQVSSTTTITVSIVEGVFGSDSSAHPGQGYEWGGPVGVDEYLKWGVGLYLVEGVASGTPGWSCSGSGYIKLDGNPLSKPIGQAAGGLTVVGGLGAAASTLSKRRPGGVPPTAQGMKDDLGRDLGALPGGTPKTPGTWERDLRGDAGSGVGCLFFLFGPLGLEMLLGGAAVVALRSGGDRVWVRGHTVWGAISGLVMGVGIAVLGQQFALWPLTILTAIAFPIYAAILGGARAWLGRSYRRGAVPAPPPPPPAAPPPMPMP